MKYTRKDIMIYRIINLTLVVISIFIIIFLSKLIGFGILALSLFFLFRPFNKSERLNNYESEDESLTLNEMFDARNNLGIIDDNFVIIAKMISTYYMEFSTPKYKNRFKDEIALYTTIGVLDTQIYVFQEKSISVQEIKNLAFKSLRETNPLLDFTLRMGILISKSENPDFSLAEIEDAWESKRADVLQTIDEIINNFPQESYEEEIVKNHSEKFFNIPETKSIRMNIGITE